MATKLPATKTTDELQIDCEVAAGIIAEYSAFCAKQLAAEKRSVSPNADKIKALESQLTELHREEMELGVDKPDVINKALSIYGPILKNAKAQVVSIEAIVRKLVK